MHKCPPFNIVLGVLFGMISAGFARSTYLGKEKGFFGGDRFWYSSLHSLSFFVATVFVFFLPVYAYVVLLIDVVLGTAHYAYHRCLK
jgi:hypothetical protein